MCVPSPSPESPKASSQSSETHASLATSQQKFSSFDVRLRMRTVKQLRTRHSQLASDTNRLKLDPKGIEPLEKSVSEIEKLNAEVA